MFTLGHLPQRMRWIADKTKTLEPMARYAHGPGGESIVKMYGQNMLSLSYPIEPNVWLDVDWIDDQYELTVRSYDTSWSKPRTEEEIGTVKKFEHAVALVVAVMGERKNSPYIVRTGVGFPVPVWIPEGEPAQIVTLESGQTEDLIFGLHCEPDHVEAGWWPGEEEWTPLAVKTTRGL